MLSAAQIAHLGVGRHGDGAGLYLQVRERADGQLSRSWIYRYAVNGKSHDMGLGPFPEVSLKQAREKAFASRQLLKGEGRDPLLVRQEERAAARVQEAKLVTFEECALQVIKANEPRWGNAKHATQWTKTLEAFAFPVLGKLPVGEVDTPLVLKCLEPIWATKTETASRLRARIEAVLDYARVHHWRTGDNPARWRGHLEHVLAAPQEIVKPKHHPALPYEQMADFWAKLRMRQGVGAKALAFIILTACRCGDVTGQRGKPGARWADVDLGARVWTIPSTKTGAQHRVPLSGPAVMILEELERRRVSEWVFPGERGCISYPAIALVMHSMKGWRDQHGKSITIHGFRSSFRDWAAEQTSFEREVCEAALAHAVGNKVEAAYRRRDLFEKRARLMEAWARHCLGEDTAKVIPLHAH
jgi:integrase